jgi:hypothetical protein
MAPNLGHGPVAKLSQAEPIEAPEGEARYQAADEIGKPVGQYAQRDSPGDDRQPEEIARHYIDWPADRDGRDCAMLAEIEGDLAA